jgi:hypothetical protein
MSPARRQWLSYCLLNSRDPAVRLAAARELAAAQREEKKEAKKGA